MNLLAAYVSSDKISLIRDLTAREIALKYKSSHLGILWALLTPLLTWGVYAVIFSGVLSVHTYAGASTSRIDYLLTLFSGLSIFFFASEVITASPSSVSRRPNFVKKVVFPLPVLVIAQTLAAGFTLAINCLILLLVVLLAKQTLYLSWVLLPILLMVSVLFMLGIAFMLAAFGVYVPDIEQAARPLVRVLFYLTPIVYPLSMVPIHFRGWVWVNPLTSMVESLRLIVVFGELPGPWLLGGFVLASLTVCVVGYRLFAKLAPGFADVL